MVFIKFSHDQRLFPWRLHIDNLFAVVWNASQLSAVCCLVLVLFYQPEELCICSSLACRLFTLPSKIKKIPLSLSVLLIVYPFITIIYLFLFILIKNLNYRLFFVIFEFNYEYAPTACIEITVVLMCYVVSRSLEDLNRKLKKMNQCNGKTFKSIIDLLKHFLFVSKFGNRFAKYFSVHFLNIFSIYLLQMICYAIILIKNFKIGDFEQVLSLGIHVLYITGRLFFLCHWCQQVTLKVS